MFLGSHPKQAIINVACLLTAIGHFFLSNSMEHKDRIAFQTATIIIEAYAVGNNINWGVRIRW
jgi:hypothetical protein